MLGYQVEPNSTKSENQRTAPKAHNNAKQLQTSGGSKIGWPLLMAAIPEWCLILMPLIYTMPPVSITEYHWVLPSITEFGRNGWSRVANESELDQTLIRAWSAGLISRFDRRVRSKWSGHQWVLSEMLNTLLRPESGFLSLFLPKIIISNLRKASLSFINIIYWDRFHKKRACAARQQPVRLTAWNIALSGIYTNIPVYWSPSEACLRLTPIKWWISWKSLWRFLSWTVWSWTFLSLYRILPPISASSQITSRLHSS